MAEPKVRGLEIRELTPELLDDYLYFFDTVAFADFRWWSACYCRFFQDPSDPDGDSSPRMKDRHRALARELVLNGQTEGFLAYVDGKPVGWCNAAPRASYRMPRRIAKAIDDPNEPVGSTVCFIVGAEHRGRGVASALLQAALARFRRLGLRYAEGYPNTGAPTGPYAADIPWSAHHYHGPVSMYEKASFRLHKQFDTWAVYRRSLVEGR